MKRIAAATALAAIAAVVAALVGSPITTLLAAAIGVPALVRISPD